MGISDRLKAREYFTSQGHEHRGSVTLAIVGFLIVILSGCWQPSSVPRSTRRRDDSSTCGHSDQCRWHTRPHQDGPVASGWQPEVLVQLEDGPQVLVPPERLHRQGSGSYTLHPDPAELEDRQIPGSTISGYSSWSPIMVEEPGIKKP